VASGAARHATPPVPPKTAKSGPQPPKSAIESHLRFAEPFRVHGPISTSESAAVSTPPPRNISLRYILPSAFAPGRLWEALSGLSWRRSPQTYKKPESIWPVSTASGCPPTGLVPPWTHPIPIEPPPNAFFDQASLSTSPSRTLPSLEKTWRRRPARSRCPPWRRDAAQTPKRDACDTFWSATTLRPKPVHPPHFCYGGGGIRTRLAIRPPSLRAVTPVLPSVASPAAASRPSHPSSSCGKGCNRTEKGA